MKTSVIAMFFALLLSACASVHQESTRTAVAKVLSVQMRQQVSYQPNVTGAAIGALAGGGLGSLFGKGNGNLAATIAGAGAGGYYGSQVDRSAEVKYESALLLQLADGQTFTVTVPGGGFRAGQDVRLIQQGNKMSIEPASLF